MGKILMVVNIRHENWKYVFHFTHSYRSFYHKVLFFWLWRLLPMLMEILQNHLSTRDCGRPCYKCIKRVFDWGERTGQDFVLTVPCFCVSGSWSTGLWRTPVRSSNCRSTSTRRWGAVAAAGHELSAFPPWMSVWLGVCVCVV